jgi:hypothetical protein
MRTRLQITAQRRNFTHRPAKPALGNGRIQRAIKRAETVYGAVITTAQALEWAYALRRHQQRPIVQAYLVQLQAEKRCRRKFSHPAFFLS